jgi:hypothetical protein
MRSETSYPGKGGKSFAMTNRALYGVDGGGHDSHSKSRYPDKQGGKSFALNSAKRAKSNADGVSGTGGGNYGTKGI